MWNVEALRDLGVDFDPLRNAFTYTFPPPHFGKQHGTVGRPRAFESCANWPDFSLYLHIPFCEMDCDFCSLHREVLKDQAKLTRYLGALAAEMRQYRALLKGVPLTAVYIGGGTPTILDLDTMGRLFDEIASNFDIARDVEVCVEFAPSEARSSDDWRPYLRRLAQRSAVPLTRISFGVQSLDEPTLKSMGRRGGLSTVTALLEAADQELPAYNIDLIIGYQESRSGVSSREVAEGLLRSLRELRQEGFRVPSVSFYQLWDTKTVRMSRSRGITSPAEVGLIQAKWFLQEEMFSDGYAPTIVSTLVREREFAHRWVKHRHLDFRHVGMGSGIYSILPAELVQRPRDIPGYVARSERGELLGTDVVYGLSDAEVFVRRYVMGLRSFEWLPGPATLSAGTDALVSELLSKLSRLIDLGLVEKQGDQIRLATTSFFVANELSTWLHPQSHPRQRPS